MSEINRRRSCCRRKCAQTTAGRQTTKLGSLRFIVILLSFISLLSRIIYCSYATWLTFTTFDCIPCAGNQTTKLFVSQHSLVKLNTVRALDTNVMANKTNVRVKRYDHQNERSLIDDYYSTKRSAHEMSKRQFDKMTIQWTVSERKPTENEAYSSLDDNNSITYSDNSSMDTAVVSENMDEIVAETERNLFTVSSHNFSDFTLTDQTLSSEIIANSSELNQTIPLPKTDEEISVIEEQNSAKSVANTQIEIETTINDDSDAINTSVQSSEDIDGSIDALVSHNLYQLSNQSLNQTNVDTEQNAPKIGLFFNNEYSGNTSLNESLNGIHYESVDNNDTITRIDKSLKSFNSIDDKSNLNSLNNISQEYIESCSEECGQFLNIKLNDPKDRKWAMVFITCFLYLYALVMLTIFLGSCFSTVDLLIIATFIEGAKLFAGFVMLIVDNINGKKTKFSLIEVKINVDQRGNGWTADFYYSEYLLDLIIFMLAAILSVKSFRIFSRRTDNASAIEASTSGRNTYRARHSSNTSTSRMLHTYHT